jgi:hypothetical protein
VRFPLCSKVLRIQRRGGTIACLFLANADTPPSRVFPFAHGAIALLLQAAFRLSIQALIRW